MSEDKVIKPAETVRIGAEVYRRVRAADKPCDVVMTGLEAAKLDRARDLIKSVRQDDDRSR